MDGSFSRSNVSPASPPVSHQRPRNARWRDNLYGTAHLSLQCEAHRRFLIIKGSALLCSEPTINGRSVFWWFQGPQGDLGGAVRFPCLEKVNIILAFCPCLRAVAFRCYLFYLAYCSGLLFVDLIFLSPTKGPLGKDTSCGWIIDDSLLFSVCVLWFYLLWFKGPNNAFVHI